MKVFIRIMPDSARSAIAARRPRSRRAVLDDRDSMTRFILLDGGVLAMNAIPWKDVVTVTAADGPFRKVVAEGPLDAVLARLDVLDDAQFSELVIAFPERRWPPFRYTRDDLATLRAERLNRSAPGLERCDRRGRRNGSPDR